MVRGFTVIRAYMKTGMRKGTGHQLMMMKSYRFLHLHKQHVIFIWGGGWRCFTTLILTLRHHGNVVFVGCENAVAIFPNSCDGGTR